MPIGNDVVDLRHPLCQPDAIHPRFDSRAFTKSELDALAASETVHPLRWSLWAAKESAFKALRKLESQVRFIPRDFAVRLNGDRAKVAHHLGRFDVWLERTDHWVHALASHANEKPSSRLAGDASVEPWVQEIDLRDRVRRLASSALGAVLGISPNDIEIVSADRVPQAEHQGRPLPFDLSLSHDGRFFACAWKPI